MIQIGYCQYMGRYNAWQNNGLIDVVQGMSQDDLARDQGAFFGSIWGTMNHLLWGDEIWISRLDKGTSNDKVIATSTDMVADIDAWVAKRRALDSRILSWASTVTQETLDGDLTWHSASFNQDYSKPMAVGVMQMFNHQTHHRGQIHTMLTAQGKSLPDTDIPLLPETA